MRRMKMSEEEREMCLKAQQMSEAEERELIENALPYIKKAAEGCQEIFKQRKEYMELLFGKNFSCVR